VIFFNEHDQFSLETAKMIKVVNPARVQTSDGEWKGGHQHRLVPNNPG
jgi:hypothetical protein